MEKIKKTIDRKNRSQQFPDMWEGPDKAAGSGPPPEHLMKSELENKMMRKESNRTADYYTVDQVFWGLVALLIIWCLIALMTGSLF